MADTSLPDFRELLVLERASEDHFRTRFDRESGSTFGGEILARAATAAMQTCSDKQLHSVHARFLRPVLAGLPMEVAVDRLSDGRRLAHRRVAIEHNAKKLFELSACFVSAQEGIAYQEAAFGSEVPQPEDLPTEEARARAENWEDWQPWLMEWRWPDPPSPAGESSEWLSWVRLRDSELLAPNEQTAAMLYMSDVHSDWSVARKLGAFPRERFISLDHVVWIHRPVRWDGWLLVRNRSDVANSSRALTHREVFTHDGRLLATISQEALLL